MRSRRFKHGTSPTRGLTGSGHHSEWNIPAALVSGRCAVSVSGSAHPCLYRPCKWPRYVLETRADLAECFGWGQMTFGEGQMVFWEGSITVQRSCFLVFPCNEIDIVLNLSMVWRGPSHGFVASLWEGPWPVNPSPSPPPPRSAHDSRRLHLRNPSHLPSTHIPGEAVYTFQGTESAVCTMYSTLFSISWIGGSTSAVLVWMREQRMTTWRPWTLATGEWF